MIVYYVIAQAMMQMPPVPSTRVTRRTKMCTSTGPSDETKVTNTRNRTGRKGAKGAKSDRCVTCDCLCVDNTLYTKCDICQRKFCWPVVGLEQADRTWNLRVSHVIQRCSTRQWL